ncbi:hypothetical protein [Roseateles toxinivorans]|uniref:Uncharacterized protein n=1 Tax=Roseateles toxinivorans TaxID=270368 RepID=A0A4R6QS35_9BURK|nr:hypothetical protein [Roseateles toxinivorans]TDP74131.1 hypothetical protein DES47_101183 [Roseateles toxinivorans]
MMPGDDWLARLQCLAARFPQYGVGADLAGLALADLWGVYCFLQRMAER